MGRLFWKFFIFLWLAQLTSATGVGVLIWLKSQAPQSTAPVVDVSPPARFHLSAAAATLRHGGIAALRDLLDERSKEPGPPVFVLDEAQQEIRGRAIAPDVLAQIRQLATDPATGSEGGSGVEVVLAADGQRYALFVPPHKRPGPPGAGHEAGGPPDSPAQPPPPHPPHFPPLLPIVAGVLVSFIFAALLAWYFSKPIRSLRAAFDAAAEGRLEQQLAPAMGSRRDELADLGHDFDRMTQRLKTLMDSQQRLLHDVSHELRSPLARLQAAIGLVRQQPERSADLLSRIERESERMDHLVDELLTLSRVEAGMAGRLDQTVELGELLAGVIEDAAFEAEARDCQVRFVASEHATVKGNAELLHRALDNVVRNAVKHSPDGTAIEISLALDVLRQRVVIQVGDQGSGVTGSDLGLIFEPFFRGQSKHSADSHGLGLAIAQRVVVAHGGQIAAENRATGGFMISISLPLLAPA